MKILEINKFYYSRRGADKHFIDVVDLLESKSHEVAVFAMHHPQNRISRWSKYFLSYVGYNSGDSNIFQKIKGVARMFYSSEAKLKINALLDEFKPDIVHIHNIYHQLSPMILFEIKKRKIPVVMTVHDYKIINPNHSLNLNGKPYDRCRNGKYHQCVFDKCVKNSYAKSLVAALEAYWHEKLGTYKKNIDLYIVPSLYARNVLSDWGIDSRKIKIIPHSVDISVTTVLQYTGVSDEAKKETPYALYFGSVSREKGSDILINIFNRLEGIKLYLAGILENGFKIIESGKIKYLGLLGQRELQNYIKKSSFVISGSRLPETFGLVALEANTHGKLFVGFKTGALSEIIENGVNGFLVNNESEMSEIVKKIMAENIAFDGQKIKEKALDKYGQERYYSKLLEIFGFLTPH